jgi:hypothetical protein
MTLVQLHGTLATACLIFSIIVAGYGFLRYFRGQGVDGNFLGTVAVAEVLYLVQFVLGLALLATDAPRPARLWVHVLYGSVLVLMFPAAYGFTRGSDSRREMVVYALMALFLIGITLRSMSTAALGS